MVRARSMEPVVRSWLPQRWEKFVLNMIADSEGVDSNEGNDDADEIIRSCAAAAKRGISFDGMQHEQITYWLKRVELHAVDKGWILSKALVRSFRLGPEVVVCSADEDTVGLILLDFAERIAEAYLFNNSFIQNNPEMRLDLIRPEIIQIHLQKCWGVSSENSNIAAMDRGFGSFADAVEAARPFILLNVIENSQSSKRGI